MKGIFKRLAKLTLTLGMFMGMSGCQVVSLNHTEETIESVKPTDDFTAFDLDAKALYSLIEEFPDEIGDPDCLRPFEWEKDTPGSAAIKEGPFSYTIDMANGDRILLDMNEDESRIERLVYDFTQNPDAKAAMAFIKELANTYEAEGFDASKFNALVDEQLVCEPWEESHPIDIRRQAVDAHLLVSLTARDFLTANTEDTEIPTGNDSMLILEIAPTSALDMQDYERVRAMEDLVFVPELDSSHNSSEISSVQQ